MAAMVEVDPYDRLMDACRKYTQWPYTLLKETTSRAVLQGYHELLLQNDDTLFDSAKQRLVLWEAWPGAQRFRRTTIDTIQGLTEHLIRNGVDPNCRHIFIESDHSRAPLNFSAEMLKLLFTYHQVDPSFLESVIAFGDQEEPVDAGLAHFRSDDKLSTRERLPFIARIDRSGRELQHSFLLRTVERAENATEPWSIRQVAAYHSFDLENGRSFWITLKGNDLFQRRVIEDSLDLPVHQGAMGPDVGAAFEASLATHLIFFRWCEENWRWYVRDMEERIRSALVKVKTVPVDSEPRFTRRPHKTETGMSSSSKGSDMKLALFSPFTEKRGSILQVIKEFRHPRPTIYDLKAIPAETQQPSMPEARRVPEGILVLNMLNHKDLQRISSLTLRLEEATLVIQLNLDALRDVYEYYERPIEWDDLKVKEEVKNKVEKSAAAFRHKLRQIIRSLETRLTQIASLRKKLDKGQGLYENLLQLRSLQVSRILAENGQRSAIHMESIARRTERETVSMNIITSVTLLFLPATFLATFFQSGVFQWTETPDITGDWSFRTAAFGLYMAICIPMTLLALLFWAVVKATVKTRAKKKALADEKEAEALSRTQGITV